ncbi:MAG: UTP--glucose-1-phosphate uridylyltransferase [Planctomycetes bacterium]|nr:UTP--glucose-1-phosphate uridylyltransferase [Planctomycetota bacterium]
MSAAPAPELLQRLERHGQAHVLRHLGELSALERARFLGVVEALDLPLIDELARLARAGAQPAAVASFAPPEVFRPRREGSATPRVRELRERGEELQASGAVAWLLVAGGQASRLGYEGPKGAFPVGPVSRRSLFEIFARKLLAARARYGVETPWYVLTSEANDATTREFFARHGHFGLPPDDVVFFRQAMLPALDEQGRILFAARNELFLAPNGHGGVLAALASSGALAHARARGIRVFSYFQVDNPLAPPADPLFLGLHAAQGAQMSSKVVPKRDPAEKVGVIGRADGKLTCIEYSDLPNDLREARDARGELVFGDGNIALHAIDLEFVDALTARGFKLPWHLARKKMSVLDEHGRPAQREGFKFETFVFDALSLARASATLEVDRREEFSPVKNAEGQDSPATARADLCRLHAGWVRAAGLPLPPPDAHGLHPVEVDPCLAEDAETFTRRAPRAPTSSADGHLYT